MGGHGGASVQETSTGLLLLSPRFAQLPYNFPKPFSRRGIAGENSNGQSSMYRFFFFFLALYIPLMNLVLQIDIVPTISLLFGLGIPKHSLGVILEDTLKVFSGIYFDLLILFTHTGSDEYALNALEGNGRQLLLLLKSNHLWEHEVGESADNASFEALRKFKQGNLLKLLLLLFVFIEALTFLLTFSGTVTFNLASE
jgi:hypothetical protein